jgi:hypothetical protein
MTDVEKILDFYPSPGGSSEYVALYWGRVSTIGVGGFHGVAEEGEDIRVFTETTDEALRKITPGRDQQFYRNNRCAVVDLEPRKASAPIYLTVSLDQMAPRYRIAPNGHAGPFSRKRN